MTDPRRELRDTEFRLELATEKLRRAQNAHTLLVAKRARLRRELGLDVDPQLSFDDLAQHPYTNGERWDVC